MFYFVTIHRDGQVFYVVSPAWGKYELSPTKDVNTYLWETEDSARADARWRHLVQAEDEIVFVRTYKC